MKSMPLIASILSALFVGSTSAIAASDQLAGAGGFPWATILEKGGTIGALVWVVLIFKKRTEDQDARLSKLDDLQQKMLERSLMAVEKASESDRALSESNKNLAESINRLRDSLGK